VILPNTSRIENFGPDSKISSLKFKNFTPTYNFHESTNVIELTELALAKM
jgi:hypothetical protein